MSVIDGTVLRQSAVETLKSFGTIAGQSIFSPADWPYATDSYPLAIIRVPRERKENANGRNGEPTFFTTISLLVIGRVSADSEDAAWQSVEQFSTQIEAALLTNQKFVNDNGIQQFVSVETARDVRSESELHIGECSVHFQCEVYQQYDTVIDAAGNPISQLEEITITTEKNGETLAYQEFHFSP